MDVIKASMGKKAKSAVRLCQAAACATSGAGGGRHNMPPPPANLPFDLESGVQVTCNVGYLCVNFSLHRPLFLDLGPMYATDRRQTRIIA